MLPLAEIPPLDVLHLTAVSRRPRILMLLLLIMHSLTPTQDILKVLTPMKHLQKIELVDNDHQATHHLTPPLKELAEAAQMVLRGGSQDAGYPDRHVSVRFAQDVVRSFPI